MRVERIGMAILLLALAGCGDAPDRARVLAEAYTGPARLQLREELVARSPVVAELKHGERVDIVGRRRRFLKVRTADGVEGWTDSSQLLASADMTALRVLAERAAAEPSQGVATSFDVLNAHTAPNRNAPSFFQLTPDRHAEVVTHQRAPRVPFDPPAFMAELVPAAKSASPKSKKPKKETKLPPPRTAAPAVPGDWLALSGIPEGPPPETPPPPPQDWWTLVRDKEGHAGWVLTRLLYMAIPEEVAQYAERARIMAYFPLGEVAARSGDVKKIWLWATMASADVDHHFDSLRVFTWNTRRGRYETAHIERGMKGWLPIALQTQGGQVTGWTVVVEEKGGSVQRRVYSWNGFRARVVERTTAEVPQPWYARPGARAIDLDDDGEETAPTPGLLSRWRAWWRAAASRAGL